MIPGMEARLPQSPKGSKVDNGETSQALTTVMCPQIGGDMPMYAVADFTFSDEDTDTEFTVMYNGKRFLIRLFADSFSGSHLP